MKIELIDNKNIFLKIFSTETKSIIYSIPSPPSNNNLPVTSIQWKPDGKDVQQYGNIILSTCNYTLSMFLFM